MIARCEMVLCSAAVSDRKTFVCISNSSDVCVFSCSRTHDIPDDSCTLLFPGMYANFELEQSMRDEYDTGLCHFSSLYLAQLAELFISAGQMLSVCLSGC